MRSPLSPYWKNDLPPTTKRFKGLHTDNVLEKVFYRTQRGSNYELSRWYSWVVSFSLPIPLSTFVTKFEPLYCLKKIVFQYSVCVRSFEHFCGGRKIVLQYGDSGRSFPKDSINIKCLGQEQEQVSVAIEFTVQVSTFC